MRLLGARLLVAPIPPKLQSHGGIHLLSVEGIEKLWRVLEIGQGITEIQKGDAVLLGYYQHHDEFGDGRIVIKQEECLAVIRESTC